MVAFLVENDMIPVAVALIAIVPLAVLYLGYLFRFWGRDKDK